MNKVYFASRYSRHLEMQEYCRIITRDSNSIVTSRWIWGNHQIDDKGLSQETRQEERERFAREDYEDLMNADLVISFTEVPRSTNSRGGRHVEFGIALGCGKRVVVIGYRENVFHCLPQVEFYASFEEFWKKECLL